MHTSKSSLPENFENHDYGEKTLKGFSDSFDPALFQWTVGPCEMKNSHRDKTDNIKLLGRTTAAISGVSGIKGFVVKAFHEPSGQEVAVKRYTLEDENEDSDSCRSSQEKFNENVTFILVR